jgi:hypothetical protein
VILSRHEVPVKLHAIVKSLAILTLAGASIQAEIVYDFVGTGTAGTSPEPVAFQLTVLDFINPPFVPLVNNMTVGFTCGQLDSSTNCATSPPGIESVIFTNRNDPSLIAIVSSAALQFQASNGSQYDFFFNTGAFDTPGVYTAYAPNGQNSAAYNAGTLKVSVPEAANATLLDYSLLLGALIVLFKRARYAGVAASLGREGA